MQVCAPGGPPVDIPVATSNTINPTTKNAARFIKDLMRPDTRHGEPDAKISQKGDSLVIQTPEAKNAYKVHTSFAFMSSKYYRRSWLGEMLFISTKAAHAGKIKWHENAVKMRGLIFSKLQVSTEDELYKMIMSPKNAENAVMNSIVVQMLMNADLPQYIITMVAEGMNPYALVDIVKICGPFDELLVEDYDPAQTTCNKCMLHPGPFRKGVCLVCHEASMPADEPRISMLSKMSILRF